MAWTKYQRFLGVMMVVTGSINTLSTKWADQMESKGSDGTVRKFEHPFLQVIVLYICIFFIFVYVLINEEMEEKDNETHLYKTYK